MTRFERSAYFEQLVVLREQHALSTDRVSVLSVADAIRYVEAVMTAIALDEEPWQLEPELEPATADVKSAIDAAVHAAPVEREWPAPFPRRHRRHDAWRHARHDAADRQDDDLR